MNNNLKKYLTFAGLFLVPFILRLIYISQLKSAYLLDVPIIDADFYYKWAQRIASGDILGKGVFLEGPLCPYILGVVFKIFGSSVVNAVVFQSILGSLSCVLIFLIARKTFNSTIAVISWIIAIVYPFFIFMDGLISNEPYIIFFNLLLVFILIRIKDKPRIWLFLAAGSVIGISSLGRPNIFLLVPLIVLWLLVFLTETEFPKRLLYVLPLIGGICIILSIVGIRNYAVSGKFAMTTSSAGINFWIGNGPEATGTYVCPGFCTANPFYEHESYRAEASKRTGKELDTVQSSSYWLNETFAHVIRHPLVYAKLEGKKALYLISGYEIPGNAHFYFYKMYSHLLRLPAPQAGLVIPLAIAGMLFFRKWNAHTALLALFVLGYALNNLLVFALSEYRLPMMPFLIIFAADFLYRVIFTKAKNSFQFGKAGKYISLLLAVFLIFLANNKSLWPMKGYANHYEMLGISYYKNARFDDALQSFNTALRSGYNTPSLHYYTGCCLREKNLLNEAITQFEAGKAMAPNDSNFYREIGETYKLQKKYHDAEKMLREAVRLNPDDLKAKEYLKIILTEMKK